MIQHTVPRATSYSPLKFVSLFSTPVIHPSVIARAEVLKQHAYHEDYIHSEDYELFTRLIYLGYKTVNVNEQLYFLRTNPASVSKIFEKIQISTHTRISKENIENYFNISLEYFLHKVLINRISFDVSVALANEAFSKLEELKKIFIKKENCSADALAEIELFIIEQKIDILFQSIKCSGLIKKIPLIFLLLKNSRLLLNKRGYEYVKSKITSKTKM